jgi:hypothetical protein
VHADGKRRMGEKTKKLFLILNFNIMKLEKFLIKQVDLKKVKGGSAALEMSIGKTFDCNTITVRPSGNSDDGDDNAWDN